MEDGTFQKKSAVSSKSYYSNIFVYAPFPHRKTEKKETVITDPFHTYVYQVNPLETHGIKIGEHLPYGAVPRVILVWLMKQLVISSQAISTAATMERARLLALIRQKHYPRITEAEWIKVSRRIVPLPKKLADFTRELGYADKGGPRGDLTRVKAQLLAMLGLYISIIPTSQGSITVSREFLFEKFSVWYEAHADGEYFVQFGPSVEEAISDRIWPFLSYSLDYIRSSPLDFDIFMWVLHKQYGLQSREENSFLRVSFLSLLEQFGSYPGIDAKEATEDRTQGKRNFKRKFIASLKVIENFYPALKNHYSISKDFFIMWKTELQVPIVNRKQPNLF